LIKLFVEAESHHEGEGEVGGHHGHENHKDGDDGN
jgi:hypothetical protein